MSFALARLYCLTWRLLWFRDWLAWCTSSWCRLPLVIAVLRSKALSSVLSWEEYCGSVDTYSIPACSVLLFCCLPLWSALSGGSGEYSWCLRRGGGDGPLCSGAGGGG